MGGRHNEENSFRKFQMYAVEDYAIGSLQTPFTVKLRPRLIN